MVQGFKLIPSHLPRLLVSRLHFVANFSIKLIKKIVGSRLLFVRIVLQSLRKLYFVMTIHRLSPALSFGFKLDVLPIWLINLLFRDYFSISDEQSFLERRRACIFYTKRL